jgi:hypothetical protein
MFWKYKSSKFEYLNLSRETWKEIEIVYSLIRSVIHAILMDLGLHKSIQANSLTYILTLVMKLDFIS